MEYTKEIHKKEHNSLYDPLPDCEYCVHEVYRRTHKCFGDGSSSVPIPVVEKGTNGDNN